MEKKRSKGILLVGASSIVGGSIGILLTVSSLLINPIVALLIIGLNILHITFGAGLLCIKEWARIGSIAITSVDLIITLVFLVSSDPTGDTWLKLIRVIIAAIIIYYLTRPKVKERFKEDSERLIYIKNTIIKGILIATSLLFLFLLGSEVPILHFDRYTERYFDTSESRVLLIETVEIRAGIVQARETHWLSNTNSVGPYVIIFTMLSHEAKENFKKFIIHSVVIKDALESKEFVIHSINDKPIEYSGKKLVPFTTPYISYRGKKFHPLYSEEQKLEVIIDVSIVFKDKTIRQSLKFNYDAESYHSKGYYTLKEIIMGSITA